MTKFVVALSPGDYVCMHIFGIILIGLTVLAAVIANGIVFVFVSIVTLFQEIGASIANFFQPRINEITQWEKSLGSIQRNTHHAQSGLSSDYQLLWMALGAIFFCIALSIIAQKAIEVIGRYYQRYCNRKSVRFVE